MNSALTYIWSLLLPAIQAELPKLEAAIAAEITTLLAQLDAKIKGL